MRYYNLEKHEKSFMDNPVIDSQKYELLATSQSWLFNLKPTVSKNYFYPEVTEKDIIVLHFTCGVLKGDIKTLTEDNNKVSVQYLVGRNGIVFQLYNPQYWAYHLGRTAVGGNTVNSKRSIAIEISNIGPLKKIGTTLKDIYGVDYCPEIETEAYEISEYRGYTHFATYTEAQYDSLRKLIAYVQDDHNIIDYYINNPEEAFLDRNEALAFKGICSHQNFRTDKADVGPAFDWDALKIIEGSEIGVGVDAPQGHIDIKGEDTILPIVQGETYAPPPYAPPIPMPSFFETLMIILKNLFKK